MNFVIDHARFRADVAELCLQLRALKQKLGATWTESMAAKQQELCRLRRRATELYALRAFSRGKLHVIKPPAGCEDTWNALEFHRAIAGRLGPVYAVALVEGLSA